MIGKKEMLDAVAVLQFKVDCLHWAFWLGIEWDDAGFDEFLRIIFEDPFLYFWFVFLNLPKTLLPKGHPLPRHSDFRERLVALRGFHEPYRSIWEWMCSLPDLALARQLEGDCRDLKEIIEQMVQFDLRQDSEITQRVVALEAFPIMRDAAHVTTIFHVRNGDRWARGFHLFGVQGDEEIYEIRNPWIEQMLAYRLSDEGALPDWWRDEELLVLHPGGLNGKSLLKLHSSKDANVTPFYWGPMFADLLESMLHRHGRYYYDPAYDEGHMSLEVCHQLASYYPPKYWSLCFADGMVARVIREALLKFVQSDLRRVREPAAVVSYLEKYLPKRIVQRLERERKKILDTVSIDKPIGVGDDGTELTFHDLLPGKVSFHLIPSQVLPIYKNKTLEYVKQYFFRPTKEIAGRLGCSEPLVSKYKAEIKDEIKRYLDGKESAKKTVQNAGHWDRRSGEAYSAFGEELVEADSTRKHQKLSNIKSPSPQLGLYRKCPACSCWACFEAKEKRFRVKCPWCITDFEIVKGVKEKLRRCSLVIPAEL